MANREKVLTKFSSKYKTRKRQDEGDNRKVSSRKREDHRRQARQAKEAAWEDQD